MTKVDKTWIRSVILLFLLAGLTARHLFAVNPDLSLSQYAHSTWRVQDGAFRGAPNALAQTKDGYLWIGTEGGLVRFDGVRFVSWDPPAGTRLLDPRVFSLLGARDGSLWIGTGFSISHLRDHQLINYPKLSGRVEAIVEAADGAVWFVRTQITDGTGPVCRILNEEVQCYGKPQGIPFPIATQLRIATSGELWIGGYSEVCRWNPTSLTAECFPGGAHRPETFASVKAIAPARDGTVWMARDRSAPTLQLQHLEQGTWVAQSFPQIAVDNSDVTTLFVDRDNALWIGTSSHGVFRIYDGVIHSFGQTEGLAGDAVVRFFQDHEGSVWVVTSAGIDNFRDLKVISYTMREGLSAAGAGTVLATRDGTVWIGNFHALDFLRENKLSSIGAEQGLPGRYITTFFEDHANRLWVGVGDGLWVYENRKFRSIRRADGSTLGIVFSIAEDTHHEIWVRAGRNLDRIADFRIQDETTSPEIATTFILAANPKGGLYLGEVNGDLMEYEDGQTHTVPSNEVGNTRQIRDLLVEPDGSVWGTTLDEVARWKDGVRKNLTVRNGLPCDEIFALVEDARGSLWIESKCGVFGIERSQLDEWWEHPDALVKFTLLDASDGMQAGLTPLKPQATRGADGRLWFVNGRILQMLDPAHLPQNPVAPPVQIEGVVADRKGYSPQSGLRLPALTRDLEIEYTALSFVAPQKVQFRYMLEGQDRGWQETRTRRQAFYNDLSPGHYRFRVMASNNDGVWNEAGAALDFTILPAYYQTLWFRMLCTAVLLMLFWAYYQFRVHELRRQFATVLEARVTERTRIARELHDTLLQTLHGLLFQFQAVRNLLPRRTDEAMVALDEAINETEKALVEGRDAIQDIRSEPLATGNIAELLTKASQELGASVNGEAAPQFDLIEEGERRTLSPTAKNEICRIALELLRNAYRHAHATRIEAEIRYDDQMLRVRVRDNGKGIDPKVLQGSRVAGHWGLQGVRERAERIGAKLDVWTEASAGTEVQLTVQAEVAYEHPGESVSKSLRDTTKRPRNA